MADKIAYRLEVPLDASSIKNFKPDRAVKVIAYGAKANGEATVRLDAKGKGAASFSFKEPPGSLKVALGPETASVDDLKHLQTIAVDVPASRWRDKNEVVLTPVQITPYYWNWWWEWCRTYTITGRVLCADGSAVAGANVCAFDVDWWWWWRSQVNVGCATTAADGSFQITFTRCCGWWPWWWWITREWLLDPVLVDRILPLVGRNPAIGQLANPSPKPSLDVFQPILNAAQGRSRTNLAASLPRATAAASQIDPSVLNTLRTQLLEVLPREFPYPIWPWYPWWPWWNCNANVFFQVTQTCNGQTNTIVNQTIADTQWDIPTSLNVTLTANSQACCSWVCPDGCPDGNCFVPTDICDINVGSIGGNIGAPAVANPQQVGLYNPGVQDRPFASVVDFFGLFGTGADVDYYEFQYSTTGVGGPWAPLPSAALSGFSRSVLVTVPPPVDFAWVPVGFPVNTISDGSSVNHFVYETISHYEANNGTQIWDSATHDLLLPLLTDGVLANGTYYLRLVGYTRPGYAGNLNLSPSLGTDPGVLTVCPATSKPPVENYWAVTIDNRAPGNTDPSGNPTPSNPAGCPSTAGSYCQPCGGGTVHACTNQPTTDIFDVQILHKDGTVTPLSPCGNAPINCDDVLLVDFVAYDPDAFLYEYTLNAYYGDNLVSNLVSLAGSGGITSGVVTMPWAPAALQVGPDYASALGEGATSPVWAGGTLRLQVNASTALPVTCAYLLQLVAYKRPIVDCESLNNYAQYNISEWSFTVQNNCTTIS